MRQKLRYRSLYKDQIIHEKEAGQGLPAHNEEPLCTVTALRTRRRRSFA